MLCVVLISVVSSNGPCAALIEHLKLLQQSQSQLKWRSEYSYPRAKDHEDSHDAKRRITLSRAIVSKEVTYQEMTRPESESIGATQATRSLWRDGVLSTLKPGDQRVIRFEASPSALLGLDNPTQNLIPGIYIIGPSQSHPVIHALQNGQIENLHVDEDDLCVSFYLDDADLDRWHICASLVPQFRITSLSCEQAVALQDKSFDERVIVRTEVRIDGWRNVDAIQLPSSATRTITAYMGPVMPREKWPVNAGPDGSMTASERWELIEANPLNAAELQACVELFVPNDGDFIDDRRLDIGYDMGGNTVVQGMNRFTLPPGERITHVLDATFLEKLPALHHERQVRHPVYSNEPTALRFGWVALIIGMMCIAAGGVMLLVFRRGMRK